MLNFIVGNATRLRRIPRRRPVAKIGPGMALANAARRIPHHQNLLLLPLPRSHPAGSTVVRKRMIRMVGTMADGTVAGMASGGSVVLTGTTASAHLVLLRAPSP